MPTRKVSLATNNRTLSALDIKFIIEEAGEIYGLLASKLSEKELDEIKKIANAKVRYYRGDKRTTLLEVIERW